MNSIRPETPHTRHLTTDEEVQAVPPRTVLRVHDGSIVARFDEQHGVIFGDDRPFPWTVCRAPAIVLWVDGDPTGPPAAPSTAAQPEPNHFVKVDLERTFPGDRPDLVCKAPADAECHAVWECDCEQWVYRGVDDGRPWHDPRDLSETDRGDRHFGRFDPAECNLVDWAENSDECLKGVVTLPVSFEWDGDGYVFYAATGGAR